MGKMVAPIIRTTKAKNHYEYCMPKFENRAAQNQLDNNSLQNKIGKVIITVSVHDENELISYAYVLPLPANVT